MARIGIKAWSLLASAVFAMIVVVGCNSEEPATTPAPGAGAKAAPPAKAPAPTATPTKETPKEK